MSEQGIAERLRQCVTDFRNGHSGEWGGSVADLIGEAVDELDRLKEREREAFDAGWKAVHDVATGENIWKPSGTLRAEAFAAYLAEHDRKDH
jgi:hypothetical protein